MQQEEKIPGSTRINYGEYACKAWQAAEKADEDMHRRRALGEKVTWKAKYTRYRSNLSGYFKTHIDKLFGSNFSKAGRRQKWLVYKAFQKSAR